MTIDASLSFILFILFASFILPVTSNYIVFLKLYLFEVLCILIIFFINHNSAFSHDLILLISFIVAVAIRLLLIPIAMSHFLKKWWFQLVERNLFFGTFTSMIIMIIGTLCSYALTIKIFGELNVVFMTSIILMISWFLVLINHKKIIGHVLGFIILENALFLITISLAHWLNIYIELGILINVLMSLIVFGISILKIKHVHWSLDLNKLTQLID